MCGIAIDTGNNNLWYNRYGIDIDTGNYSYSIHSIVS